jgi:hypothetical protein
VLDAKPQTVNHTAAFASTSICLSDPCSLVERDIYAWIGSRQCAAQLDHFEKARSACRAKTESKQYADIASEWYAGEPPDRAWVC